MSTPTIDKAAARAAALHKLSLAGKLPQAGRPAYERAFEDLCGRLKMSEHYRRYDEVDIAGVLMRTIEKWDPSRPFLPYFRRALELARRDEYRKAYAVRTVKVDDAKNKRDTTKKIAHLKIVPPADLPETGARETAGAALVGREDRDQGMREFLDLVPSDSAFVCVCQHFGNMTFDDIAGVMNEAAGRAGVRAKYTSAALRARMSRMSRRLKRDTQPRGASRTIIDSDGGDSIGFLSTRHINAICDMAIRMFTAAAPRGSSERLSEITSRFERSLGAAAIDAVVSGPPAGTSDRRGPFAGAPEWIRPYLLEYVMKGKFIGRGLAVFFFLRCFPADYDSRASRYFIDYLRFEWHDHEPLPPAYADIPICRQFKMYLARFGGWVTLEIVMNRKPRKLPIWKILDTLEYQERIPASRINAALSELSRIPAKKLRTMNAFDVPGVLDGLRKLMGISPRTALEIFELKTLADMFRHRPRLKGAAWDDYWTRERSRYLRSLSEEERRRVLRPPFKLSAASEAALQKSRRIDTTDLERSEAALEALIGGNAMAFLDSIKLPPAVSTADRPAAGIKHSRNKSLRKS